MQKLLLDNQRKAMLANGAVEGDHRPVVKLFCPWGAATWLLTELDPTNPDIAFGLCDLGMGCPELGNVSLTELRSVRGPFGLYIERDIHFKASAPLSRYTAAAQSADRIVEKV
jgi:hypothetical protein